MAQSGFDSTRASRVNDRCPCGSGKKYKRCHGAAAREPVADPAPLPALGSVSLAAADNALAAGKLPEAQSAYLAILERDPLNVNALFGMAMVAEHAGDADASLHYHMRLAEMPAANARVQFALGNFFAKRYDFERARSRYRRVVDLVPEWSGAWNNLGNVEKYLGNLRGAIACYDRAVATDPDNAALHSNALISVHYDYSTSHDQLFARHLAWTERHAARYYPHTRGWVNSKEPDRRLRLGYLSACFDGRILGHFLRNVLPHHDDERFATYAYSSTLHQDDFTASLRSTVDHWREIRELPDDAVAAQVETDEIDILVDLDGHTPGSRLLVCARKPAPVQVTWLGYFNTTGLRTVDYILTDRYTTPDASPQRFTEIPLRLPDSRFCYAPVPYAPPVSVLPRTQQDAFTFGSFNRYDKLGPEVIDSWAEILRRVPASRLIIKNSAIAVPYARMELSRRLVGLGIPVNRFELRAKSPHADMLAEYGEIDLGLDTFPYNGGLTTCEALWMGVPIVAIEEERMISRQTSAMLRLVGAEEFIARTRDEYVALAVQWANDVERLASVRQSLRERMRSSPLCDGVRFTKNLERVLRTAWQHYCAGTRGETV